MRAREFVMKDAYSFDMNQEGLDISYKAMYEAYCRIFKRLKLDYLLVDADSGAMGGSGSQEFMVKSQVGEDAIAYCQDCGYAANEEKAPCKAEKADSSVEMYTVEKIHTPHSRTIDELTASLGVMPDAFIKTILYDIDSRIVAVMVRGDREINETKLKNLYDATEMSLAGFADVERITGAAVGFAGPIGLKEEVDLLADPEIMEMHNAICGANETDYHLKNVNPGRDFTPARIVDLRNIVPGDPCPKCGKPV